MAGSISRATEKKPGGLEVILCRLSHCRPAAPVYEMDIEKDRFSRPKNSSYTAATLIVLGWGNGFGNTHRNGPLVTTSHLFWPNEPRKAALLLRNWQPNLDFPGHEGRQGRGVRRANRAGASTEKGSQNFLPNGSPTLSLQLQKNIGRYTCDSTTATQALNTFT
jgi:hypothetical protein